MVENANLCSLLNSLKILIKMFKRRINMQCVLCILKMLNVEVRDLFLTYLLCYKLEPTTD